MRTFSRVCGLFSLMILMLVLALAGCNKGSGSSNVNVAAVFSATMIATYDFDDKGTPNDVSDDTGNGEVKFEIGTLNGTLKEYRLDIRYTIRDTGQTQTASINTTTNPLTFAYLEKNQLFQNRAPSELSSIEFLSGDAVDTNNNTAQLGLPGALDLSERTPVATVQVDYLQDASNSDRFRVRYTRIRDRAGQVNGNIYLTTETLDQQSPAQPVGTDLFLHEDLARVGNPPNTSALFADRAIHSGVRHTFRDVQSTLGFTYEFSFDTNFTVVNGNLVLVGGAVGVFAN